MKRAIVVAGRKRNRCPRGGAERGGASSPVGRRPVPPPLLLLRSPLLCRLASFWGYLSPFVPYALFFPNCWGRSTCFLAGSGQSRDGRGKRSNEFRRGGGRRRPNSPTLKGTSGRCRRAGEALTRSCSKPHSSRPPSLRVRPPRAPRRLSIPAGASHLDHRLAAPSAD